MWCSAPVLLRHLLQRFHYPAHIVGRKHRMDLYGSAESKEEGFRDNRELGSIVHVDDEVSTSCGFDSREVRRFGLEVIEYSLDGLSDSSSLTAAFPSFMGCEK